MTDPERLLRGSGTDAERRLLRAADAEEPPAGGAAELAAMLVAPSGMSGGGGQSTPSLPPAGAPLLAKWGIVAATAIAVGSAIVALAPHRAATEVKPPAAAAPVASAPAPEPTPEPAAVEPGSTGGKAGGLVPEALRPAAPLGAERAASQADVVRRHASSPSYGGAASIAGEIESLDEVRGFLAKGEPRRALAELDRYKSRSPQGAMAQEAALLRIEALVRAGDAKTARGLGMRFLTRHPGTPYEKRVRALIGPTP